MLTIEPQGGLANRMRSIDSAIGLAQEIGVPVRLVWNIDPNIGSPFRALFEMPAIISEFREVDKFSTGHWIRKQLPDFLKPRSPVDYDRRDIAKLVEGGFDLAELRARRSFHMKSDSRFYWPQSPFAPFKPIEPLQNQVDSNVAKFENTIGVHIRRSDNNASINHSPTELFVEKMKSAIANDPQTTFFLATDDPAEEAMLREQFPDRILSHDKRSVARHTQAAIEDALIDLYCLSNTQGIFASYGSSFSQTAAQINNIEIQMISENAEHIDPHHPA